MRYRDIAPYWCDYKENLVRRDRTILEPRWQRVAEFFLPNQANITKTVAKGQIMHDPNEVVDSTAMRDAVILATALHGTLTNPVLDWFTTGVKGIENPTQEQYAWSQRLDRVFRDEFAEGNFYPEVFSLYIELAVFGTAGMFVEDVWDVRDNRFILNFKTCHINNLIIDEDNLGRVDTVIKPFKMTVKNIANSDKFSNWRSSEFLRKKYDEGKLADEIDILHICAPKQNDDYAPGTRKWLSIYIEKEHKHILNFSEQEPIPGYDYFPWIVVRWNKGADTPYGNAPALSAIYDVLSLNKCWKMFMDQFHMMLQPPILHEPGIFTKGTASYEAGSFTEVEDINRVREMVQNRQNAQIAYDIMKALEQKVDRTMMIDQIQFPPMETQGTPATATEWQARFEVMQRMLGPSFGRFVIELLKPLFDTGYMILKNRPQDPELNPHPIRPFPGVENQNRLNVEYIGPLRISQEMPQVIASQNIISEAIQIMSQTGEPIHSLDMSTYIRKKGQITKAWADIYVSKQEENRRRDQYEQARQQAMEAQTLQGYAKAGKDGATADKMMRGG